MSNGNALPLDWQGAVSAVRCLTHWQCRKLLQSARIPARERLLDPTCTCRRPLARIRAPPPPAEPRGPLTDLSFFCRNPIDGVLKLASLWFSNHYANVIESAGTPEGADVTVFSR